MPTARFDAIGIVCADLSASIAFYRLLGLDFPDPAEGQGHVEATTAGGIRVMLDTVEVIQRFSEWSPPVGSHRMNLAFACETRDEVDAVYASLIEAGHASIKEPWDAFWGQRYAQVSDPDGNPVDLFC